MQWRASFILGSFVCSFSLNLLSRLYFSNGNLMLNTLRPAWFPPGDGWRSRTLSLTEGNSTCRLILRGDRESTERALLSSLTVAEKHVALTEVDYLRMTRDCQSFVRRRRYITSPLSRQERDFPLAYSMVIHESIEMFERLLRAIYAPQNVYCVHVDRKSPGHFRAAVRAVASCFGNVFVAARLESVTYASWSRVQADLNCMEELLGSPVPWRYLINVCGKDFPIKTNREMVESLRAMNGTNVVDSYSPPGYKVTRWKYHYEKGNYVARTSQLKAPPPIRARMFVGSAYVFVTRDFVRNLFVQPEIRAFFNWSMDTYSPDEHVWATLQGMPDVPGSLPGVVLPHPGSPTVLTRAVKWSFLAGDVSKGASHPPCTGRYLHLICIYGAGDLAWVARQEPLFANKFDMEVDNTAVQCMEEHVRNRTLHDAETLP